MALTSTDLKKITTEARPIIERQLEDAAKLAGLRDVVAAAGGDWSQLKALIKAQIRDENDEAGDGKHVQKILDKAEYATAYADMLGLGSAILNEKNSISSPVNDSGQGEADGAFLPGNQHSAPSAAIPEQPGFHTADPLRSAAATRKDADTVAQEPEPVSAPSTADADDRDAPLASSSTAGVSVVPSLHGHTSGDAA